MKRRIILSLLAFSVFVFSLHAQPINIELTGCPAWNGTYTSPGVYTGPTGGVAPSCPCYESDDANNLVIVNIEQGGGVHIWAVRSTVNGTCAEALSASGGGNLGLPTAPFPDSDCDITNEGYCGDGIVNTTPVIPTMGEWALIIFGLIVLSFGVVSVMRWQKTRQLQTAT